MFRSLKLFPLHFLLLQLPEASVDLVEKALNPHLEQNPWTALALLVPYFLLMSALSSAMTFVSVREAWAGRIPSLGHAWWNLRKHVRDLLPAVFLAGLVTLISVPLILPTLYFLAIYLFVPQLTLSEPGLPTSVYLSRSKKMVRPVFKTALAIACALFGLSFAVYFVGDLTQSLTEAAALPEPLGYPLYLGATLTLGAFCNVGISEFFLRLRGQADTSPTTRNQLNT